MLISAITIVHTEIYFMGVIKSYLMISLFASFNLIMPCECLEMP